MSRYNCDALRGDPLFKLAVGRAPESGRDLCSQPTMSRMENAPSRIEVARMTAALVDIFCRSFPAPPAAIIKIARLGGYLDRAKDPPPGNIVMWRGLSRLTDIALGATLKIDDVGN